MCLTFYVKRLAHTNKMLSCLINSKGGKDAEQQKAMQDRARQQEDAKNSILSQIMDQNARARCKCMHTI